jgi:hypothetical protein
LVKVGPYGFVNSSFIQNNVRSTRSDSGQEEEENSKYWGSLPQNMMQRVKTGIQVPVLLRVAENCLGGEEHHLI